MLDLQTLGQSKVYKLIWRGNIFKRKAFISQGEMIFLVFSYLPILKLILELGGLVYVFVCVL